MYRSSSLLQQLIEALIKATLPLQSGLRASQTDYVFNPELSPGYASNSREEKRLMHHINSETLEYFFLDFVKFSILFSQSVKKQSYHLHSFDSKDIASLLSSSKTIS